MTSPSCSVNVGVGAFELLQEASIVPIIVSVDSV